MTTRFARLALPDGRAVYCELVDGAAKVLTAAPWLGGTWTGEQLADVDDEGNTPHASRLAPVEPSKILCVGRNYRAHASELGNEVPAEPLLFWKPPSSVAPPGGTVELPPTRIAMRIDHEAELAVVVGRRLRRASAEEAASAVFGYTALCDVTARDLQKKDGQWTRAKGMDTFCPVGPVVVAGLDVSALRVTCRVSGELRQDGTTASMVFSVPELLAYASQVFTLEPGDVFATGTPSGVGPLADGDRLEVSIEGIGTLALDVRAT